MALYICDSNSLLVPISVFLNPCLYLTSYCLRYLVTFYSCVRFRYFLGLISIILGVLFVYKYVRISDARKNELVFIENKFEND